MKHRWTSIFRFTALFSILAGALGCDLFNPRSPAENLTPVDSMAVFHNLINAYNTLDYEAFLVCLDSSSFRFIPKDTTLTNYDPWGYTDEQNLTFKMFDVLGNTRRIPPILLQVDTTYFSSTDTLAYLHANYLLITPLEEYDTLGGGFELEITKRGNYWYISSWKDVAPDTIFVSYDDTLIDTISPWLTEKNWSDLKVFFRKGGVFY